MGRFTEAVAEDALEHLRGAEYEYPRTEQSLRAIGRLLEDWRRLRGLIDFYGLKLPPQVEIAKSAALVAEAKAIRAEKKL